MWQINSVTSKIFIDRIRIMRASARPLRARKNIRLHEYSIFSFMMDRYIFHLLGEKPAIAILRTIFY
jgi:hypothetical protein